MYESILLKLKAQRDALTAAAELRGAVGSRVSDRTLEAMAKSLAVAVTTQEQVDTMDLTEAINGMDGNIAHVASKEVNAYKATVQEPAKPAKPAKPVETPKTDEVDPAVKALTEQVAALTATLSGLTAKSQHEQRKTQFEATLNGLPPIVAEPLKNAFAKMQFESDEDFTQHLGTITNTKATYEQSVKEGRLPSMVPLKEVEKPVNNGTTPDLAKALKLATEAKAAQAAK